MKRLIVFIASLLVSVLSFSQEAQDVHNQYDENGDKTGLWITQDSCWRSFAYYKNGKRDGVFYRVNTHYGTLCDFTRYLNGEIEEQFTFHDKTGVLLGREYNFRKLDVDLKSPYKDWTWDKAPDRICHSVEYYPNGNIKAEGDLIFWSDDGPEIDFIEYGEWKYYNEDGTMKEKKDLSKN